MKGTEHPSILMTTFTNVAALEKIYSIMGLVVKVGIEKAASDMARDAGNGRQNKVNADEVNAAIDDLHECMFGSREGAAEVPLSLPSPAGSLPWGDDRGAAD